MFPLFLVHARASASSQGYLKIGPGARSNGVAK
jgi:hypothetical protein